RNGSQRFHLVMKLMRRQPARVIPAQELAAPGDAAGNAVHPQRTAATGVVPPAAHFGAPAAGESDFDLARERLGLAEAAGLLVHSLRVAHIHQRETAAAGAAVVDSG